MKKFGTREEVINGLSKQTRGGLTKQFLKYNAEGKIISIRRRKQRGGVPDSTQISNPYSNLTYTSANQSEKYTSLMSSQNTKRIYKVATTEECIIYYQNGKNRYYFNASIDISYDNYLLMLVKAINHSTTQYDIYKEFIVSIDSEPTELNKDDKSISYLTNIIYWDNDKWYIKSLLYTDINKYKNINILNNNLMFLINNQTNSDYENHLPNTDERNKSIQDAVEELQRLQQQK